MNTEPHIKPVLCSPQVAMARLGIGKTKFWRLAKHNIIRMVDIGMGRRMVDVQSIEALAARPARQHQPEQQAA
jgi:hypothetical protein